MKTRIPQAMHCQALRQRLGEALFGDRLARQLLQYAIAFSTLLALLVTGLQLHHQYSLQRAEIDNNLTLLGGGQLATLEASVWRMDGEQINLQLHALQELSYVEQLVVRDDNGQQWLAGKITSDDRQTHRFDLQGRFDGQQIDIGSLTITLGLDPLWDQLEAQALLILGANLVKSLLAGTFILLAFHRLVTRHLVHIAAHGRALALNDDNPALRLQRSTRRNDALDSVSDSINGLSQRLQREHHAVQHAKDRLQLALEGSRDALWDWDMRADHLWWSPAWQQLIDFSDEQMNGYQWHENIHPDDRQRVDDDMRDHYDGLSTHFHCTYRHRSGDGGWRWIEARGRCTRDADGQPERFAGHLRDIDAQRRAEQALRSSQSRLSEAQRIARFGCWDWDIERNEFHWPMEVRRLLGISADATSSWELLRSLIHPDDRQRVSQLRQHILDGIDEYQTEYRVLPADGSAMRWIHSYARSYRDEQDGRRRVLGVGQDITERKHAEEALRHSEARLQDAIESLDEGFVLWGPDDRMVMCNQRQRALSPLVADLCRPGVSFENILRAHLERGQLCFDGPPEDWVAERRRLHREGGSIEQQLMDGRWLLVTERPTAEGGVVCVRTDITAVKHAEEKARRLAYYDDLTGLPNRSLFHQQLIDACHQAQRHGWLMALMFIDLDRFKNLNDTLGHAAGDQLLREAAKRLRAALRDSDIIARLGGDEFTVLAQNLRSPMSARRIAEQLLAALAEPCLINGHQVHTEASIGITLCPSDGDNPESLLQQADMAMYAAKAAGRNTAIYFTPALTERAQHALRLEAELRKQLAENTLEIHYQPVVALHNGGIEGAEALLRCRGADGLLYDTEELIAVAEETGLIDALSDQLIARALADSRDWQQYNGRPLYLSVNISSRQFRSHFGPDKLTEHLAVQDFDPARLVLEITESTFMEPGDEILPTLEALRGLGVRIALDDFGTGYSSLGYLRRFPVDILKIDRSFVRDMDEQPAHRTLVKTVVAMAHSLNLHVIAEGVEQPDQQLSLAALGCRWGQGFLFSPGLPAAELEALLSPATRHDTGTLPSG